MTDRIKWEVCPGADCELWWEEQVDDRGDVTGQGWFCNGCKQEVQVRRPKLVEPPERPRPPAELVVRHL